MAEIELLEMEEKMNTKEYLEQLIHFFQQSTKENSIVFHFELDPTSCTCKIIKYELDGSNQTLEKRLNNKQDAIENILEPLITHFINNNKIIINNIASYKENTSSLKIISEENDMCNIQGIDEKLATRLSEMVEKSEKKFMTVQKEQQIDNKGVGNVLAFILSLFVLGIVILSFLLPNFMK